MSATALRYHCGTHHPIEQMRRILTKNGKRWRCIKSIKATKAEASRRDAFGKRITAINRPEARATMRRMAILDRGPHA